MGSATVIYSWDDSKVPDGVEDLREMVSRSVYESAGALVHHMKARYLPRGLKFQAQVQLHQPLKAGQVFRFHGLDLVEGGNPHGAEGDRNMRILGISVDGSVSYTIEMVDSGTGLGKTVMGAPLLAVERMIELGIWRLL